MFFVSAASAQICVTLMVVHGEGTFRVGDEITRMGPGKLLRVPFRSPMSIQNESKERLAFLIFKAPHPNEKEVLK
jgi:mannose-6-phosphate isomerase-like protein (cupin superfamily)